MPNGLRTNEFGARTHDNESIQRHAGWAIKRGRDVIFKGKNELVVVARETADKDSSVFMLIN